MSNKNTLSDIKELLKQKKSIHAFEFVLKLSSNKNLKQAFKKVFSNEPLPTMDDLQNLKTFYEADDSGQLVLYTNKKDSEEWEAWQTSFNKLSTLFPTPGQWIEYKSAKFKYPYFDYNFSGSKDGAPDLPHFPLVKRWQPAKPFKNLSNYTIVSCLHIPDKKAHKQELEQLKKQLPLFNEYHNDPDDGTQYLTRAKALIELFPYQIDIISSLKEEIERLKIFIKVQELKKNGMSVPDMRDEIEHWLIKDLGFTHLEIKRRFKFSLEDAYSFNRLVNKHVPFHN